LGDPRPGNGRRFDLTAKEISFWHAAARLSGEFRPRRRYVRPWPPRETEPGISAVIPSRNGRDLLAAQLPGIARELEPFTGEIIVVDNGSHDGTAAWLAAEWPCVQVELSAEPLSFARAVNRGIARARFSHVCLLNNDMILEPGFFRALTDAFARVPRLFCATAQIFFPEGVRREETGKAVYAQPEPDDFPIRCDVPVEGEDLTWVLYGSGGCSLYDAARLRELGSLDEAYYPVYVEDLDICYRAWQRGWPTIYVAGARLEHRHRATASRYYTEEQLDTILEVNYLRFIARAAGRHEVFRKLWRQALDRLKLRAPRFAAARQALQAAWRIALEGGAPPEVEYDEESLLALSGGAVAVFPGGTPSGNILVSQVEQLAPPAPGLLASYAAIVLVSKSGGMPAYDAALAEARRRWPASRVTSSAPEFPAEPARAPRNR
jgi:GT2 family glycosyltransferase